MRGRGGTPSTSENKAGCMPGDRWTLIRSFLSAVPPWSANASTAAGQRVRATWAVRGAGVLITRSRPKRSARKARTGHAQQAHAEPSDPGRLPGIRLVLLLDVHSGRVRDAGDHCGAMRGPVDTQGWHGRRTGQGSDFTATPLETKLKRQHTYEYIRTCMTVYKSWNLNSTCTNVRVTHSAQHRRRRGLC